MGSTNAATLCGQRIDVDGVQYMGWEPRKEFLIPKFGFGFVNGDGDEEDTVRSQKNLRSPGENNCYTVPKM